MNTDEQLLADLHQDMVDCEELYRAARLAYDNVLATEADLLQAEKDMMAANLRLEAAYHAIGGASDYV